MLKLIKKNLRSIVTFILLQCLLLGINYYETGSFQFEAEFRILVLSITTAFIGIMIYQLSRLTGETKNN